MKSESILSFFNRLFLRKRFLLLAFYLPMFYPVSFMGSTFYYGDSAHYYFSLGNFREYIDSFIAFGSRFNLNDKKVIFIISMFTTAVIAVGILEKGNYFQNQKLLQPTRHYFISSTLCFL